MNVAAISSTAGSSLDVKAIADSLTTADVTPAKNRLNKLESDFVTELSAIGQIKSALAKLQSSMSKLSDLQQFYSMKTTLSDTNAFDASATANATSGNYQIEVKHIATRQSLASAAKASSNTVIGHGSLTIAFGSYNGDQSVFTTNPDKQAVTINIAAGQDSLQSIRDTINNSNSGVKAAIVQDDQGARLTLTSPETGKEFAMKISVNDSDGNNTNGLGLSALAYDPTIGNNQLQQTIVAIDSEIKINGLTLTQGSNRYKDAIAGVTIDLKKAADGNIINLAIEKNSGQVTTLINEFIKQYNDAMTTINGLTTYNKETKQGGYFQSDASIRGLKLGLSKWISQPVANSRASITSLADIGIKTNAQGLLTLKTDVFNASLENHYSEIGSLFAKTATASDGNISINSLGSSVKAGKYDVNIDSFIPGSTLTGTIGGIHASSTDGRTLKGSGDLKDLSVDILGGGVGFRGSIQVTDGVAVKLNDLISSYLGDKGNLNSRTNQINKRIEDVGDQRARLQDRANTLYRRYITQYSRLDVLLSSMQKTSESLAMQLSGLPDIGKR